MADSVLYIGDRKTSAHRDSTLVARYELAKKFCAEFPVDGDPFTTESFDNWAVSIGRMVPLPEGAGVESPEWAKRLQQRHRLKEEINLGGKCELFDPGEQFQIKINEHGKSFRVVPLLDRAQEVTSSMPDDVLRTLDRERREVERMINAFGVSRMTETERAFATSLIESIDDHLAVNKTLSDRYLVKLSRLKKSLEMQAQGVLPALIEPPRSGT